MSQTQDMLPATKVIIQTESPGSKAGLLLGLSLAGFVFLAFFVPVRAQEATKTGSPELQTPDKAVSNKAGKFSHPYGYYLQPILEHIHANPDQRVKITAIVQSYRGRIEPLQTEYRQRNQQLLDKLSHGESSTSIMDDQMRVGRLYTDINLYYCQMSLEVRKVLGPEQIVLYEEFKRQQGWNTNSGSNQSAKAN